MPCAIRLVGRTPCFASEDVETLPVARVGLGPGAGDALCGLTDGPAYAVARAIPVRGGLKPLNEIWMRWILNRSPILLDWLFVDYFE